MLSSIKSLLFLANSAAATIYYAGVAESGGEFGAYSATKTVGTGLPGKFGTDYSFLNAATVPTWIQQNKINTFRVAFLLERMCPLATGLGATFNETHFGFYQTAINAITSAGGYAILDPHNYMRYNDPSQQPSTGSIIGDTTDPKAATTAQFGAFWGELAGRFATNPNVIFGLMNEPHDMSTQLILQNNQAAINAIRAAGAYQLVLAPGNGYTGGHSWTQSTCATCDPSSLWLNKIVDPVNNTAIDIHEYLDSDFSGSHQPCTQPGPSNLAPLTAWLQTNNLKAMVTEFGGDNNTQCDSYITDIVNYMAENPVYIGWTAWAAGPFWGTNSPCCTDSAQYGSLEPGSTAAGGGPSLYDTVWIPVIEPLLPTTLQTSGISNLNGPGGVVGPTKPSSSSSAPAPPPKTSTVAPPPPPPSSTSTSTSKSSSSSKSSSTSTTKTSTSSTKPAAPCQTHYGQCGGIGWSGATCCAAGTTCKVSNPYYSQCL